RRALLLEKESLLRGLKDLEFERDAGKLSEEDFEIVGRKLRSRAKQVLRLLDDEAAPFRAEAEALVEAHLAAAGIEAAAPRAEAPAPEASVEQPQAARVCASCATTNDPDAAFCKKCGAKLSSDDSAAESAPEEQRS
ncbi:MAG: zinc ribbon domain-containing protein, partial [Polyangiaceae bacterium]|nr:zinc ribbon domain-containing protein [Polyangiaceae bacterium]